MYSEFAQPSWILSMYFLHALLILLLFLLVHRRIKEEDRGVLSWITVISLFLPVIGEAFGLLAWAVAKRVGVNDMMEDYEEYVTYKPLMLERIRHESRESYDILPLVESFNDSQGSRQQETIMRLINSNISEKGRYLNIGLMNTDAEMVHYSATTINLLMDKHEKEVELAKEKYASNHSTGAIELLETYERYMDSGLLEGVAKQKLEQEYEELLTKERAIGHQDPLILQRLGQLYLSRNEEEKGVRVIEELIGRFPQDARGYLSLIHHYYRKNDRSGLKDVLLSMQANVPGENIPEDRRYVLQQMWGDFS
ncbi:tetratricopeptide repeat protein [Salimicrobium flavidum]|uniref:Tetratricopeptide repeat-containing protein n=1 Tax=Salimicrobium flavidum TaxID=570947 RepID=A0A1N7J7J9_9BACI|nr:hypothetical protein [Salimicrobium flavidum]SIS45289.1 hypothetical protein SAMN05421687_10479 [Salimicrobium flavidum]